MDDIAEYNQSFVGTIYDDNGEVEDKIIFYHKSLEQAKAAWGKDVVPYVDCPYCDKKTIIVNDVRFCPDCDNRDARTHPFTGDPDLIH